MISGKPEYLTLGASQSLRDKICFYSDLNLQKLLFPLFSPFSHLSRRCRPALYILLLTPFILCHSDFVKSPARTRKNL
jgi:hypothetical protein